MLRFFRILRRIALLMASSLLLICIIFWVSSFFRSGGVRLGSSHGELSLESERGLLRIASVSGNVPPRGIHPYDIGKSNFLHQRFAYAVKKTGVPAPLPQIGIAWRSSLQAYDAPDSYPAFELFIPYWILALLPAMAIGILLLKGRHRRLPAPGAILCSTCSYDLRAHSPGQKCPECGTPIPAPSKPDNRIPPP